MSRLPSVRADRVGIVLGSLALFVSLGGPSEAASLIDGKRLKAKSVAGSKLRTGAVTSTKLASNAVTGAKVRDGAISASDLAPAVLAGVLRTIPDGSVTTAKLGDASITAAKLAPGALDAAKLADGAVGSAKLADGAVGTSKLAEGAVGPTKLADGAVGSTKLADGAVGTTKLADGAITGAKVADGSLRAADVASVQITQSIDFPSIPANSCDREVVVVPGIGVTDADSVLVTANASDLVLAPEGAGLNLTVGGQGSNVADRYRVVLCNPSVASVNPPPTRFTVLAFRP